MAYVAARIGLTAVGVRQMCDGASSGSVIINGGTGALEELLCFEDPSFVLSHQFGRQARRQSRLRAVLMHFVDDPASLLNDLSESFSIATLQGFLDIACTLRQGGAAFLVR